MKIVKFEDGTYAVRRGWLLYTYLDSDLYRDAMWWPFSYVRYAKLPSYAAAQELITRYNKLTKKSADYGTPVKQGLEIG